MRSPVESCRSDGVGFVIKVQGVVGVEKWGDVSLPASDIDRSHPRPRAAVEIDGSPQCEDILLGSEESPLNYVAAGQTTR